MRIALAQTNPTVGDIDDNARGLVRMLTKARELGADLVVTPELSLLGYPPKDLLLKPAVLERSRAALDAVAEHALGLTALIGLAVPSDKPTGRSLYNSAALCRDGRVASWHHKSLLPTYDVFDERRYFEPGPSVELAELVPREAGADDPPVPLGVSICEDLWNQAGVVEPRLYHHSPVDRLAEAGAEVIVNLSASPFVVGKHAYRIELMGSIAKRLGKPVVFCNQVGGNDELVFDGRSMVLDAERGVLAQAKAFEEDLLVVDLPSGRVKNDSASVVVPEGVPSPEEEACGALVLGVRDYCRKCGFKKAVLGLSGGIDSAVTAAIAVAALGPDRVTGVAMPSRYSSDHSVQDALELADNLGMVCHTAPIEPAHQAMTNVLQTPLGGDAAGLTDENLQARLRGVIMMALSNDTGAILLTTGNKSELAVGYCTLYGDMCGGLAVLSDVPKTMVYRLARWLNDDPASPLRQRLGKPAIPEGTITKPPSAELRPDQKDEDSLPPYDELDAIIERYVEQEQPVATIAAETGLDQDEVRRVASLIDRNEYKRKQAAPGLKITGRAFGFGRRMPIAQRYRDAATAQATVSP